MPKRRRLKNLSKTGGQNGPFLGKPGSGFMAPMGTQLILPCHQAPTSSVAQSVAISEAGFLKTDPLGSRKPFLSQKGCQ